jgi:hypothetical protein
MFFPPHLDPHLVSLLGASCRFLMGKIHLAKNHPHMVVVITDAELPGDQVRNQLLSPQMSVESTFAWRLHQQFGQMILLLWSEA